MVRDSAPIGVAVACFAQGAPGVLPVVDDEQRLVGVLTATEIGALARAPRELDGLLVAGDLAVPSEVVSADDSLTVAVGQMNRRGVEALPVVESSTGRVVGVVDRGHLLAAYERAVSGVV